MKSHRTNSAIKLLTTSLLFIAVSYPCSALTLSDYPLFIGSVNKANVLLILDNSNTMDEAPSGEPACDAANRCGSASDSSKSQIARDAAKSLITNYKNKINMGLLAYQQNPSGNNFGNYDTQIVPGYLHSIYYDISFDPATYNPAFNGNRDSATKRSQRPNPTNPGSFIYYNVGAPTYYSEIVNNAFCYSQTAPAAAFGSPPLNGFNCDNATGCENYRCFKTRTGQTNVVPTWNDAVSENALGYSNVFGGVWFYSMDDAELSRGIYDIGRFFSWHYLGNGWFSRTSPGRGYLHTPIALLDDAQAAKLNIKLERSQFANNKPTDAAFPLQNAGLTPIEGTFVTAKDYFLGNLIQEGQGGPAAAPPNSCGKNFAIFLTDGLPSTNANGTAVANPATGLTNAATAASNLRTSSAGVETYIIGFALPYGTDPATLNTLAAAGGTTTAYSATNLDSLNTTFNTIFSDILNKTGAASSVAANSSNLKTESRIFQAKFAAMDWSGQLQQYKLDNLTTSEWDTGSIINTQTPGSRIIITKGTTDGVPFQWSETDLTANQQTYLNQNESAVVDDLGSNRVAYLRGDATNEVKNGGNFRSRSSKLGDIVNSNPWYVGPPAAGYSDVDHPGYNAFRTGALNRKPVVYVGGNDGMLHGVDASLDFSTVSTGVPTTDAGKEVLAYVPSKVFPNLSKLTGQDYNKGQNHKYFVDGSPMSADVYLTIGATSSWRTTLIGGLGAGGKGYYALDITNPTNFTEANAADILFWEFTDNDDADVGFTYNAPPEESTHQAKQIVKMANGKWAVILGNGYNSAAGKAVLYVLFIEKGIDGIWDADDFVKITADAPAGLNNGLSTPVPFDSNEDGYVDTVYAGDLKGNMWKFLVGPNADDDTVTSTPSTWKLAFSTADCTTNCTPLFTAKDSGGVAQPITWPAEVTSHPTGGNLVFFGTGKYLEATDNATTGVQTFYGIHDEGVTIGGRAELTPRTISTTVAGSGTFRTTSKGCGAAMQPDCPATSKGWYADLPTSGERVTGIPKLYGSIFFNTYIPSTDVCGSGGTGWYMGMNYLDGSLPPIAVFDTNDDQLVNSADEIVSGFQVGASIGGSVIIENVAIVSNLADGSVRVDPPPPPGGSVKGRISWREIVQ